MESYSHTFYATPVRNAYSGRDWSSQPSPSSPTPRPTTPTSSPQTFLLSPNPMLSLPRESTSPKILRPPNAFMLFRSDFLKRGIIPTNVEKRQQHLSKLIAMKWNTLTPAERKYWDNMAQEVSEQHKLNNPGYKFQPSPRGSKKLKAATSRAEAAVSNQEHLDNVRATYLGLAQAPPPSPKKSRKAKKNGSEHKDASPSASSTDHSFQTPSPASSSSQWTPPTPQTPPRQLMQIQGSPSLSFKQIPGPYYTDYNQPNFATDALDPTMFDSMEMVYKLSTLDPTLVDMFPSSFSLDAYSVSLYDNPAFDMATGVSALDQLHGTGVEIGYEGFNASMLPNTSGTDMYTAGMWYASGSQPC